MTTNNSISVEQIIEYRKSGKSYLEISKLCGLKDSSLRAKVSRHLVQRKGPDDDVLNNNAKAQPHQSNANTLMRDAALYHEAIKKPHIEIMEPKKVPDDISDILDNQCLIFERSYGLQQARKWFPIKISAQKAVCIVFFGDPHLDDDGCNMPQLRDDVETVSSTDGMYAVNIGDKYADRHMYGSQLHGSSIAVIFDPNAPAYCRIMPFLNVQMAAWMLGSLRKKLGTEPNDLTD